MNTTHLNFLRRKIQEARAELTDDRSNNPRSTDVRAFADGCRVTLNQIEGWLAMAEADEIEEGARYGEREKVSLRDDF